MNAKTAISRADALRLNTISEEQNAAWLSDLDGQLAEMFGMEAPKNRFPEDFPLLMPAPHEEIYQLYLICKIDYYNQEMALYANDLAVYMQALAEARAWYRRTHRPQKDKEWAVM
jgi:hypothetical protein